MLATSLVDMANGTFFLGIDLLRGLKYDTLSVEVEQEEGVPVSQEAPLTGVTNQRVLASQLAEVL